VIRRLSFVRQIVAGSSRPPGPPVHVRYEMGDGVLIAACPA
jgi:hypothetical protein